MIRLLLFVFNHFFLVTKMQNDCFCPTAKENNIKIGKQLTILAIYANTARPLVPHQRCPNTCQDDTSKRNAARKHLAQADCLNV